MTGDDYLDEVTLAHAVERVAVVLHSIGIGPGAATPWGQLREASRTWWLKLGDAAVTTYRGWEEDVALLNTLRYEVNDSPVDVDQLTAELLHARGNVRSLAEKLLESTLRHAACVDLAQRLVRLGNAASAEDVRLRDAVTLDDLIQQARVALAQVGDEP